MKRVLSLVLSVLLMPAVVSADGQMDVQMVKDKIIDVKLDARYLKEELQNDDEYNAREYAFLELLKSVNLVRKERGQDSLLEKHLRPHVQLLSYKRSSVYKGFAYVLLSDVDKMKSGIPFGKYFDAARVYAPTPAQEESVSSHASAVAIPQTELAVTTPPASSQVVEQKQTAIPASEPAAAHITEPASTSEASFVPASPSSTMAKNQVLMSLTTMEVSGEINEALEEFQKVNSISAYGMLKRGVAIGENDYLLFFDRSDALQAFLQPIGNGKYRNFLTKAEDSLDNYRGKGLAVLWFRF